MLLKPVAGPTGWGGYCKIKQRDFTSTSLQSQKQHPPQTIAITVTTGWSIIGLALLEGNLCL